MLEVSQYFYMICDYGCRPAIKYKPGSCLLNEHILRPSPEAPVLVDMV